MQTPYKLFPTVGTIQDERIPCRDQDIHNLLKLLSAQSVTVEEMRRMGKTLLLLKLAHQCNTGQMDAEFGIKFRAKYFSFQGKQTLGEVIDFLVNELQAEQDRFKIDFRGTYDLVRQVVNGSEVSALGTKLKVNLPEFKRSWKEIFFRTLDDMANAQAASGNTLILIFDELPIMLWEWYKEGKHEEAIELLDILRERRQALEKKGVRFIYCGSIGIKIVLQTLKEQFGYTGEPTNEMVEFNLKPFREDETLFLCECFILSGFSIDDADKADCLSLIHELTSGLPFYAAHMFTVLQTELDSQINLQTIEKASEIILNDPKYHSAFRQLIDRLNIYYPSQKAKIMQLILDQLAHTDQPLDEEYLFQATATDDKEIFKECLYLLYADHYLARAMNEGKREYQFRYSIFKKWWRINKA